MAKRTRKPKQSATKTEEKTRVFSFLKTRQTQTIIGSFLMLFAIFLTISFISFFFNWQEDQSTLTQFADKTVKSKNLLGKIGANLSHFFIYKGFGIAAFFIPYLLFKTGLFWWFKSKLARIVITWNWGLFLMILVSISLGFVAAEFALLSGIIGFETNEYLRAFLGKTGLAIVLFFLFLAYLVIKYKITPDHFINFFSSIFQKKETENEEKEETHFEDTLAERDGFDKLKEEVAEKKSEFEMSVENLKPTIKNHSDSTSKELKKSSEELICSNNLLI